MIVLAVDAATDRLSVAAGSPDGRVVEQAADGARRHAGLLIPFAEELLGRLGVGLDRVDAIAVSDGPGSFTGLRVAAAWAKGVSRARDLPVWTASSLMVRAFVGGGAGAMAIGAGSAMRGEWYLAGYRFHDAAAEAVFAPTVVRPESPPPDLPIEVVVGDTVAQPVAAWCGAPRFIGPPAGLPAAQHLIRLIGVRGGAVRLTDAADWEPEYGRLAEAQAKWELEHGRALPDSIGPRG